MSARDFLIRGLLAGLLAGLATFFVAYFVGEPQIETAITLEEAGAADEVASDGHDHDEGAVEAHSHGDEEGAVVSRRNQSTLGLLTGTLVVGVALGGLVALVAAATAGRMGRLLPAQSTAVISLVGFVSVALMPFLKYPATPPAVGGADTIGERTAVYFGFVLVSVAAAVIATYAAVKWRERIGTYWAVVAGAAAYLVVVVVAGLMFPTVNEVGEFPADTLWFFRRASLITLATTWAVIGVALTGMVSRLFDRAHSGREPVASL